MQSDVGAAIGFVLLWLIGLPVFLVGLWQMIKLKERDEIRLLLAFTVCLVAYYVSTGLLHIYPGLERHAAIFTVPGCILFALCLNRATGVKRAAAASPLVATAISVLLLVSVYDHYGVIKTADPWVGNRTYQTGPEEPKELALRMIESRRDPAKLTRIRAEDWWMYWPIRYLAQGREDLNVSMYQVHFGDHFPADYYLGASGPGESESYSVVYADSKIHKRLAASPTWSEIGTVSGYQADPILVVFMESDP
jgi:hypothetical protein